MDSMRSLNTSLPSARPAPPEALLQAFRTAALSVTNLYKSAVTDQNASRQAGYQEALEDLLGFLDRENLGLQDGEGWRVRQWATERFDGSALPQQTESDDDRSDSGQRPRSITPTREQRTATPSDQPEEPRAEMATQTDDSSSCTTKDQPLTAPIFYFSGTTSSNPSDNMQTDDESNTATEAQGPSTPSSHANRPIAVSRGNRTPHRSGNGRHTSRSATKEFTFTTGTKRKFQIPDFFDISNIGPKDGSGSNKRGRIS
ncbi:hypothetical protein H2200_011719 [Cladophialophora chaetospira]|uniref:Uncharacterized protein n=1 Tax=Cladophialophora chaetospira TaxID=386627 RepID=A0AA39CCS3_9EURO|nr:hypothetical protein H2200_011719 [Cladophialophora chaetospira]